MGAPLDLSAGAHDAAEIKKRLRTSAVPLYVALSNLIRAEIEEGRWAVGAQLPTLDTLSQMYGVARVTARQALGVLADDGFIERVQGKGTFVASGAPERKIVHLDSDWHNFLKMLDGNLPEPLVVDPDAPPPRLQPTEGKPAPAYRYMRRVHRSGGQPYCVIDVYLAQHCYEMAPEAFDTQMVIPQLGKVCGPRLQKMAQSFRITSADLTVARFLDLPVGAPIGEVRRVITDKDGVVLYLGSGQYRGDLVVFNTTLEVPTE